MLDIISILVAADTLGQSSLTSRWIQHVETGGRVVLDTVFCNGTRYDPLPQVLGQTLVDCRAAQDYGPLHDKADHEIAWLQAKIKQCLVGYVWALLAMLAAVTVVLLGPLGPLTCVLLVVAGLFGFWILPRQLDLCSSFYQITTMWIILRSGSEKFTPTGTEAILCSIFKTIDKQWGKRRCP